MSDVWGSPPVRASMSSFTTFAHRHEIHAHTVDLVVPKERLLARLDGIAAQLVPVDDASAT